LIHMTIVDFLEERAGRNADDLAFRFLATGDVDGPVTEWTFAELYRRSAGVAADLVEQGLAGESVLLAFPPGLDFVRAFYGCLLARVRAVPVPLPDPRKKNPLGRLLNTARACGAETVLTDRSLAEMAAAISKNEANILSLNTETKVDKTVDSILTLGIVSTTHLKKILADIKKIKYVQSVRRLG